jgi:hypothetical protein
VEGTLVPFWSRKPKPEAAHPSDPTAGGPTAGAAPVAVDWGPSTAEGSDDEGVLLATIVDLYLFLEAADEDVMDLDAAAQAEEDLGYRLSGLSAAGMGRVREYFAALAQAAEQRGSEPSIAEGLRALAEHLDPDDDREPGRSDLAELQLAIVDLLASLELNEDERIDPDAAMKQLELAAWHLSHLSTEGRANLVALVEAEAASEAADPTAPPDRVAFLQGFAAAFDLAGAPETFDTIGAELPGPAMVSRKRAVVATPKGRRQAADQSEAARQNGLAVRWEVPDTRQAGRGQRLLRELGIRNIGIRVVGD